MQRFKRMPKTIVRSPSLALLIVIAAASLVAATICASWAATEALAIVTLVASGVWALGCYPLELQLRENRRGLRSLFVQNPEAVAIYDRHGVILRGNRAAASMMRQPAEVLIGAHFTKHMALEHIPAAQAAFDRAVAGETVEFETVFVGADAERIDVRTTLFPHVVRGQVAGVFGVAKDIGELRRARAERDEQSRRITELYAVAATGGSSPQQQIEDALALARRHLGYDFARLSELVEGVTRDIAASPAGHPALLTSRFDLVLLAKAAKSANVVPLGQAGFGVAASVALTNGTGVLQLWGGEPRHEPLSATDVDFIRLVTALVAAAAQRGYQQARLDQLAFFDSLTGLPNRVMVTDRLAELLGSPRWQNVPFAVHYVDLDRFKEVNDGFGHAVGDQILKLAARRMSDEIGEGDMLARLGGDEFVVVQPLDHGLGAARNLASRILASIAHPFEVEGVKHQLGVSIGISVAPNDGSDGQTLLQRADEALYRAKREGRNRLEFAPEAARLASNVLPFERPATTATGGDRRAIPN
jgi:diguanylate cyclase (GGDEF)-like protein/PAS domain S-box-containing protein